MHRIQTNSFQALAAEIGGEWTNAVRPAPVFSCLCLQDGHPKTLAR